MAAVLASRDFTSASDVLEAPNGFASVFARQHSLAEVTRDLGDTFEILLNTYKPYACGVVLHPAIDGCIQLRNEHKISADDIADITIRAHPLVLELTGIRAPATGLEGKFSVYHSAAAAIVDGAAGVQQYRDDCVRDQAVVKLRNRVHVETDSQLRKDEARIALRMSDGRLLGKHVEHALGSLQRPMTDNDLAEKFRGLAHGILSATQTENLLALCGSLERLDDVATIVRAAVPEVPPSAG
jgi:2-methylcitrate dehydratase PrpD